LKCAYYVFPFLLDCAVLQLSYNQLTGSIPTQLGALKKLSVVALKSNQLSGAIPATLGDLGMLVRLDLSSNILIGSIPTSLASVPSLKILDVHNNTLSGNVPPGMINLLQHLFNFIGFYPFLFFFKRFLSNLLLSKM
jgi:Leucine-rich repeat (LRR) protein